MIGPGWISRREVLAKGAASLASFALPSGERFQAQALRPLEVASAGSLRAMVEGALEAAAAGALQLALHSHAGGADGVARTLVSGNLAADVSLPVTAGPMVTVLQAGKAERAYPVARTEMVLLYSPKSRLAPLFAEAAAGKRPWWQVLQEPGLRLLRSSPLNDPSGRCTLFVLMLAAKKYGVPDLVTKVVGSPFNPAQVQSGRDVRAELREGTLDVTVSYKTAAVTSGLPFVPLPAEVNLSEANVQATHPEIALELEGKTFRPEPVIFYAAVLQGAAHGSDAARFVAWLQGPAAGRVFEANGFALPVERTPLLAPTGA